MGKNKTAAFIVKFSLALLVVIWASEAPAADPKAASTKVPDVKATDTKAADLKTPTVYKYNPVGKPDPFKPFIDEEITTKKKLEKAKALPISPLQREGIDQFKLVGIAGDEYSRKAIVQDLKGKFYPIYVGTYIGLNGGRVVQILADQVVVEEKFKTEARKRTKTQRITIKLHKEGEEKP